MNSSRKDLCDGKKGEHYRGKIDIDISHRDVFENKEYFSKSENRNQFSSFADNIVRLINFLKDSKVVTPMENTPENKFSNLK